MATRAGMFAKALLSPVANVQIRRSWAPDGTKSTINYGYLEKVGQPRPETPWWYGGTEQ